MTYPPENDSTTPWTVVTGGAGFVGSHLCELLVAEGHRVLCLDNLSTGNLANLDRLADSPRFRFELRDVIEPFDVEGAVDAVFHLASPASPPDYLRAPLETLRVGAIGTENGLRLAHEKGARFLLASTSEIYGDPEVHPQREAYWGNVNPVGPRAVYDEAKRYAEAITSAYRRHLGVDTTIARIFNSFGPRMRADDGRLVPNFICRALRGEPMTIYGSGKQTRSLCYVEDTVRGLLALLRSGHPGPVNLGNTEELSVMDIGFLIADVMGASPDVTFEALPQDDPTRRCPDIGLAKSVLGWSPTFTAREGLRRTTEWFREHADIEPRDVRGLGGLGELGSAALTREPVNPR